MCMQHHHRVGHDRRPRGPIIIMILSLIMIHHVTTVSALASQLIDTQWKTRLDVGLQPGTWMPKRFPGWAESGARLGLDLDLQFLDIPSSTAESLLGPKDRTFQLKVLPSSAPVRFVSERGQEEVTFGDVGGWCIQRPTSAVRNDSGGLVNPEGLLRFWIDCQSGAKRNDVEILPDTRLFFTTGVWDNPSGVEEQDRQYRDLLSKLQTMLDTNRQEEKSDKTKSIFEELLSFPKKVKDAEEFERLKRQKDEFESTLPPLSSSKATNGVQIAPTGSLVIKGNNTPDWMPGSEYLILGTFSTKPLP